ncbi:MAG: response regulator transcription factor [Nitrospirae bacterium]|nr:response regulator transcription factor [Nitrospirota bacterium]
MAINILIVDDHVLFRHGLKRVLEMEGGFAVVGEASDGNEAVQKARALHPNIILMDISMPNSNGIEATKKIKQILPSTAIILLTMHEDPFLQQEAMKIGASGYILKRASYTELFITIKKVHIDHTNISPLHEKLDITLKPTTPCNSLTVREKEIFRMLAGGMVNKEISEHLCISIYTVETHRKNIMKKLNLHSLSDIIKYAMAHGLIQQ